MTWTSVGNMSSDKVSLEGVATLASYSGGSFAGTGYEYCNAESYYRRRNNVIHAQIQISSTNTWSTGLNGEWRLICDAAVMPRPKNVNAPFRLCGSAYYEVWGATQGTDFALEHIYNENATWVTWKFLVRGNGHLTILHENNKDTFLPGFFGVWGGMTINLEYEV